jgi:hypothetical protein
MATSRVGIRRLTKEDFTAVVEIDGKVFNHACPDYCETKLEE